MIKHIILSLVAIGGIVGLLFYIANKSQKMQKEERERFNKLADKADKTASEKLANSQITTCSHCGMANIGNVTVCQYCGAELKENSNA